jgi:hypothetical protein
MTFFFNVILTNATLQNVPLLHPDYTPLTVIQLHVTQLNVAGLNVLEPNLFVREVASFLSKEIVRKIKLK